MTHPKPPHKMWWLHFVSKDLFSQWISVSVITIFSNNHQIKTPRDLRSSWYLLSGKFGEICQALSACSFRGSIRHLFGFYFYLWENSMSVCPCKSILVLISSCPFLYHYFPNKNRYKVLFIQQFGTLKSNKMDILTLLLMASKSIYWTLCPFY